MTLSLLLTSAYRADSPMELVPDTKSVAAYSATSTPVLDVLRPVPPPVRGRLSAGEYFFISSTVIFAFIFLPQVRNIAAAMAGASSLVWVGFAVIPLAAVLFSALLHEVGHLLVGYFAGFRAVRLKAGAGSQNRPAEHKLHSCDTVPLTWFVLEPGRLDHLRRRLFALFLAGPVTSIAAAVLFQVSFRWMRSDLLFSWWVNCLSAASALFGIASLLPDLRSQGGFSDGARLLMLFRNDERAVRWLALMHMQAALNRGLHPRDWDSGWVVRATMNDDESCDAVTANWLAYLWAAERQDIASATRFLEEALASPASSAAHLRDRLFLEAAFFQGWFRENPAKARFWAAQVSGKLNHLQQERLAIVLLWADGNLFDAFEALQNYFRLLAGVPHSPARELAEKSAREWKQQIESRMLTRAWRTMYSTSQQVDLAALQMAGSGAGASNKSC